MDFQPQMKYILPTGVPMPFYMAYPDYPCIRKPEMPAEEELLQDFEYLRQTYPAQVGRWQKRVEEILDRMDYDGSMIYDEYPDRLSLRNLGDAVAKILAEKPPAEKSSAAGNDGEDVYLQGLAQVLVCNEIYRRRRRRKKYY